QLPTDPHWRRLPAAAVRGRGSGRGTRPEWAARGAGGGRPVPGAAVRPAAPRPPVPRRRPGAPPGRAAAGSARLSTRPRTGCTAARPAAPRSRTAPRNGTRDSSGAFLSTPDSAYVLQATRDRAVHHVEPGGDLLVAVAFHLQHRHRAQLFRQGVEQPLA